MKWIKGIFISAGLLGLVCLGGRLVDTGAYVEGDMEGYEAREAIGYKAGQVLGLTFGIQAGYEDAYHEGVKAGLGHGYALRDPSYDEAVAFLRNDKTDENEYVLDTYLCSHFAKDVCNNADAEGLRCAFVRIVYPDGAHAIIAFNTIDKGLVYFDPRTDERANPVIGKHYFQCIEPKPGYHYVKPSFDDTITDILVIW